ncbi:retrotransposon protein, putative, ty1-copia subclass [Tanacetum coccineum]
MVRSMMNLTTLPKSFWGYALESAARILNMVPTKKGSEALVKRDTPDKLDSRSIKCIFIGYPKETIGYYFYYPLKNKIFVARNAEFFKNSLTLQEASGSHRLLEANGSDVGLELIQEDNTKPFENTSKLQDEVEPNEVEPHNAEEHELGDFNKPSNYKATLSDPESDEWLGAINQNPSEAHWTVVKTILKYLRNTTDMVLVYGGKAKTKLKKSAKQSIIAMYSTEAEYIVAAEASMEAVWIRKFIDGLRNVVLTNKRPMEMLCNNMPAISIANDPGIMKEARHYQRKYHYIREVIQDGEIVFKKVHTDDNVVDPFMKPMPYTKNFEHAMAIEDRPASSIIYICDVLVGI